MVCTMELVAFKYVHCDLIFVFRYLTITLTMGSTFVSIFYGHFNVGGYIKMSNVENVFLKRKILFNV